MKKDYSVSWAGMQITFRFYDSRPVFGDETFYLKYERVIMQYQQQWLVAAFIIKPKKNRTYMNEKQRAEFRALLAAYMQACSLYGHDQDKVIRGMMVLEHWIIDFADRKMFDSLKKDAKLKVVEPRKGGIS